MRRKEGTRRGNKSVADIVYFSLRFLIDFSFGNRLKNNSWKLQTIEFNFGIWIGMYRSLWLFNKIWWFVLKVQMPEKFFRKMCTVMKMKSCPFAYWRRRRRRSKTRDCFDKIQWSTIIISIAGRVGQANRRGCVSN